MTAPSPAGGGRRAGGPRAPSIRPLAGLAGLLLALAGALAWGCAPAASSDAGPAARPDTAEAGPAPPSDTTVARPVGRDAVDALTYPPLVFDPPAASEHEVLGVPVYHLHDPALPLVDVYVQLQGGPSHFSRDELALLTGLPTFIRNGGTLDRSPDDIDRELDLLALDLRVSRGGTGSLYALNALEDAVDEGMGLLAEILLAPAFEDEALEVWRGQELERVRRRLDAPQSLAFEEFNRLMFGDHPVGWVIEEADLAPERLTPERIRATHRLLYCRDRLILGVAGSLSWEETEPRVRAFLQEWPSCEEELPERPEPRMRDEGGVFVLPRELEQTVIVMAHPGGIRQEDSPEYFASRVADLILGGAGFTSRLMARVRTERGLAYGASSLWTTPVRHEGLVGAVTATGAERTVEAVELILEILEDFRGAPPSEAELERAVDQIANGYVFAFQSARQIVARRMGDRLQELPEGWLERYLEGIQAVSTTDVHDVARRYIDPDRMTILLVGDPDRFDDGLDALGSVYRLHLDGSWEPWDQG